MLPCQPPRTLAAARLLTDMTLPNADLTALLDAWSQGDTNALAQLMDVVQQELHEIAHRTFRRERRDHALQPTALVNELYLKLKGQRRVGWKNRAQFFGVAAKLMRRILVDHARHQDAAKRGRQAIHVTLDEAIDLPGEFDPKLLALDDALVDLARRSALQSRIVEMRVFVGLTLEEIAAVEKISLSTVSREWKAARLFLLKQLKGR